MNTSTVTGFVAKKIRQRFACSRLGCTDPIITGWSGYRVVVNDGGEKKVFHEEKTRPCRKQAGVKFSETKYPDE